MPIVGCRFSIPCYAACKVRSDLIDGPTASARRALEPFADQGGYAAPGCAGLLPQSAQRRVWKLYSNSLHDLVG